MTKVVMTATMMSKMSNVLRISLLYSSDDLWNIAMAVKTPTTMSNAFPPVQSFPPSFLPPCQGLTSTIHCFRRPQRCYIVKASTQADRRLMTKTVLTRAFTSVKAVKQPHQ
jgi:hypothetical protein